MCLHNIRPYATCPSHTYHCFFLFPPSFFFLFVFHLSHLLLLLSLLLLSLARERSGRGSSSLSIPHPRSDARERCFTVPLAARGPQGRVTLVRFVGKETGGKERNTREKWTKRAPSRPGGKKGEDPLVGPRLVGWLGEWVGGGLLLVEGPSRVSQRGSERRCSAIVSGGAARSRLELSHAPTSTSIHLPCLPRPRTVFSSGRYVPAVYLLRCQRLIR